MREWLKKFADRAIRRAGTRSKIASFSSRGVLAFVGFLFRTISSATYLGEFTDFMAGIVPQIDRVTALNLRPEVNRFHYSVLWAVSPVYFAIFMPAVNKSNKSIRLIGKRPDVVPCLALLL